METSFEVETGKKMMEKAYLDFSLNSETFEDKHLFVLENSDEIAKLIRVNYNSVVNDEQLLKSVFDKITQHKKMVREILTYEFLFYNPSNEEKINDINDLFQFAKTEMSKYQGIIGGYNLEDTEWVNCNDRFSLKDNQIGIFNTCYENTLYDKDQLWFMKNFVTRIKKFCGTNLTTDFKMFEDEENQICWLILVFEDKSKKLD
jgi:hypothetical protein